MTHSTIGAPMSAVTELIGRLPSKEGRRAMRLQNKAKSMPRKAVAGMSSLWSLLLKRNRAMCGTANPKKAMGPQKAVMMAVRKPDTKMMSILLRRMFTPRFSAYRSPSSKRFSVLNKRKALMVPTTTVMAKNGSWALLTLEKLPCPR